MNKEQTSVENANLKNCSGSKQLESKYCAMFFVRRGYCAINK